MIALARVGGTLQVAQQNFLLGSDFVVLLTLDVDNALHTGISHTGHKHHKQKQYLHNPSHQTISLLVNISH